MNQNDLFKLALGGLAAGCCLIGCSKETKSADGAPAQAEEGEAGCGGGPTCASCTVPSDCSDVGERKEPKSPEDLRLKREKASNDSKPEEAECKTIS